VNRRNTSPASRNSGDSNRGPPPDVLDPRPETEHVIEVALDRLAVAKSGRPQATFSGEGLEIADVGTGSDGIAIALAKELPGATISPRGNFRTPLSPSLGATRAPTPYPIAFIWLKLTT